MLNKITSIIIMLLLVSSPAFALVQFDNCDMPCCQTELSCCQKAQMVTCESSMAACDTPLLIPIVVAPVNKIEQRVDETIDILNIETELYFFEQPVRYTNIDWTAVPEPPPSFLIPLLI